MLHHHTDRWVLRLGIGAIVALLLVMPAGPVAADTTTGTTPSGVGATGAPNTPQPAGLNTPVTFSGNGFKPNESLSVWEIGPDGSVTPLSGIQSDANGAFSVTVTFPLAGQWQVTAHSITNGNESVGTYTVGGSSTTTAPTTPTSPTTPTLPTTPISPPTSTGPIAGAPVTSPGAPAAGAFPTGPNPSQVALGSPVTFSGTGYTANEQISIWETGPGAGATALPGISADGTGAFSTTVTFSTAGQWAVTAHGITSGKETVSKYSVGTTGSTTTAPTTTSTGSATNSPAANAPQVAVGAAVSFSGTGFSANEQVSLWATGPDSTVTPLSGAQADANGALSAPVTFQTPGYWQVTAHGRTSAHETIGGYNVTGTASTTGTTSSTTGAASPASGATGTPVSATSGSPVDFSANGFNANEMITVWTTDPNNVVTPQSSSQANGNGQVTITISFNAIGLWSVTTHGKDSLHEVVGKFQVT